MQRILLILESSENRDFLQQLLAPKYEVLLFPNDASFEQDFDLAITDSFTLTQKQVLIQQLKAKLEPIFLPFLLLTSRENVSLLSDDLQNTVDEVIITPVEKMELLVRIKSLLRSRHLSLELQAQNQKLRENSAMKNRFISIVAHDLRNPLSVISGSIQLLEKYSDKLPLEKKQELFDRIKASIKNMDSLLEDTWVIAQTEEGKLELNVSLINIEKFCLVLLSEFKLSYSDRQIDFTKTSTITETIDYAEIMPRDEKILRHILGNLLSNALKYSPQETLVTLELTYNSDRVTFIIKDNGIGIPKEKLSQLFEPFNRANNVGGISGSGLGLSIVKQCVDLYGGTIEVKSEVSLGTTFIVKLPIIKTNQ